MICKITHPAGAYSEFLIYASKKRHPPPLYQVISCGGVEYLPPSELPDDIHSCKSHGDLKDDQNVYTGHEHPDDVQLTFVLKKVPAKTTRILFVTLLHLATVPPFVHVVRREDLIAVHLCVLRFCIFDQSFAHCAYSISHFNQNLLLRD